MSQPNINLKFTHFEDGWIYGVWYCGTSFKKAIYYGQYPSTFVTRILTMFPADTNAIVHLCCGRCHIDGALNIDIKELPEVDVVMDAENLNPLYGYNADVVLIDPPYSQEDSTRYGVPRLVSSRKVMKEVSCVLKPGGWLLWLDEKYPVYHRKEGWALRGLIAVVTGFGRRTRILSMFQWQ